MRWKIFAVVCSIEIVASVVQVLSNLSNARLFGTMDLTIWVVAVIGLFGYAFEVALLPARFWRPFSRVFACWLLFTGVEGLYGLFYSIQAELDIRARLLVLLVSLASMILSYCLLLAVWRYAKFRTTGRPFGPISARRSDQFSAESAKTFSRRSAGSALLRQSPPPG
jgi:hypothetical protein